MARYGQNSNRVFVVVLVLIVAIVAITVLSSIAQNTIFGSNNNAVVDTTKQELLSLEENRSVVMKVRGEIQAQEDFRTYTITVTPTKRAVVVYKGYGTEVLNKKELSNTTAAYEQFVYALDNARFMEGQTSDADVRGICATDNYYEFSIKKGNDTVKSLWTTSCSSSKGSLKAKLATVKDLFFKQVPDINDILGDI